MDALVPRFLNSLEKCTAAFEAGLVEQANDAMLELEAARGEAEAAQPVWTGEQLQAARALEARCLHAMTQLRGVLVEKMQTAGQSRSAVRAYRRQTPRARVF